MNLEEKKKEQHQLKHESAPVKPVKAQPIKKAESRTFSMLSSIPRARQQADLFDMIDLVPPMSINTKESDEGKQLIIELMKQLKAQNS